MDFTPLLRTINITFKDKALLQNVFVHRSYLNENKKSKLTSNEKLEFLGDSVLSLATSIYLFRNYPALAEGDYTDIKAKIVRMESLNEAAVKLNLGNYLLLSKGEESNNGRKNPNILADCFEALIASLFIEHGFDTANDFIVRWLFADKLDYLIKNKLYLSPKSYLQEVAQEKYRVLPEYKIIAETGPEHNKTYTVTVSLNGRILGQGVGKSKKAAEEEAAQKAVEILKIPDTM